PHAARLRTARGRAQPAGRGLRRREPGSGADHRDGALGRDRGDGRQQLRAGLQALLRARLLGGHGLSRHRGRAARPQSPGRRRDRRPVLRRALEWRSGDQRARPQGARRGVAGDRHPARDHEPADRRARGAQDAGVMDVLLFVAAALRISVPYTLAAVGATFSERGGVINIGLEGIMIDGALAYVLGAFWTGNPWAGIVAAVLAGVLTAWLHAEVTVRFRADHITSGLGINLLAAGLTKFVLTAVFHSSSYSSRVVGLPSWDVLGLARLPGLGPVLATPLVLLTIAAVLLGQWVLFRTIFGLRLRSVGERPEAGATLGLPVTRYRFAGVLLSVSLGGPAGASLARR